jgi:hypothetical protein
MVELALIILSPYFVAGDLIAGGHIINSKRLPTAVFGGSEIRPTELFIDAYDDTFIVVTVSGRTEGTFLYMNDNLIDPKQYIGVWNGFLKEGHFHFALWRDETIFIYKVQKIIELVSRIDFKSLADRLRSYNVHIIPVQGPGNPYYLLASRWCSPVNPVEFLKGFLSGGHGIYYWKPFLIEVQEEILSKPRKLSYGGKTDESYYIRQVLPHGDLVHFLGFRMQEEPDGRSVKKATESVILHYTAYDLQKKKVAKTHSICSKTPNIEIDKNNETSYGPLSIDALGNNVFVAFSWVEERIKPRPTPLNNIKSTISYWQYSNGVASDIEKIGDGFAPLVKVDSSGNVHILWVDKNASLVHKAKRNGKWGKDAVLVNNLSVDEGVLAGGYVSAEFDKGDNLHIVYPSGGILVHSVLKVD